MSIFSRIFKIFQAKTHSTLDKHEDPLSMTEQGIRDLKNDLQSSLHSLAEIKSIVISTNHNIEDLQKTIDDYEKKAKQLIQKAQNGYIEQQEADRLATQALNKRDRSLDEQNRLINENKKYESNLSKVEENVDKLKSKITSYENELNMLKSRQKTAAATTRINKQLSMIDSNGTVAMIEKMKTKVTEDESLSEAYQDVADLNTSIDNEIDSIIEDDNGTSSLNELKKKMGILE